MRWAADSIGLAATGVLLLTACESGAGSQPSSRPGSLDPGTSAIISSSASTPVARPSCRKLTAEDHCVAGPLKRPSRGKSADAVLSQEGSHIFSYGRLEDFDPETVRWASVSGCPLWLDVFVTDRTDVHVLEPMSCGGDSCGGDYTGFGWSRLYVHHTPSFRWLAGGYAADERRVYYRWAEDPLEGARPDRFELMQCGGDEGFIVGHDDGGGIYDGKPPVPRWYREGKRVDEASAFAP
jgi:hypothetical protein